MRCDDDVCNKRENARGPLDMHDGKALTMR